jgi:hypothetical protein
MSDDYSKTPDQQCPFCRHTVNAASMFEPEHEAPGPGDFVLCLNCAAILRFDRDMIARKLDADALQALVDDPEFARELARRRLQIRAFIAHTKRGKHRNN